MSSVGSEADLDDIVSTSDPVLEWYSRVFSRRIDVIGDYCGHEVFLIEGDALLLHCFSDQHIDFDPGFQLLHAAWAVENFLRGLVARRCNFHVAFIDQHRELCIPPFASDDVRERYLLARAAIIKHLRTNLPLVHPEIEVNVFTSVTSDAFAEYLAATDLYFVLIHDGAQPTILRKQTILNKKPDATEDDDNDDEEEERTKIAFRQLMYWFMEQGIASALINGLEWQDTKVVTTVLENPRRSDSEIGMTFNDFSDPVPEPRSKYLDRSIFESIKSDAEPLTEREYMTVLILYALLAGSKATKEFSDAFLRHTALVSQLHLSERLVKPANLDEEATASLELFCDEASAILSSETWKDNMATFQCSCDVADLIDGRLLAACLKDKTLGRNESYQSLLQAMKAIGSGSIGDENSTSNGSQAPGENNETPQRPSDSYTVLPFSNDVFDAHLSPVHLRVDKAGDVVDATTSQIFREVSHFHNTKRPVDPKIREEQLAKSAKQQFFARRRNQWFMAEMSAYAASLTNAVGKVLEPEIITPGATKIERKEENTKPKVAPKAAKKGAPSKKEAMLAKIAADRSKKEEASAETLVQGWRLTCNALEKEPTPVARFQKAKQYLTSLNSDLKRNALEAEVRLYLLNALLGVWVSACRAAEKDKNLHVAALIFDNLSTFSTLRRPITKTIASCLEKTYKEMALPKLPIPAPEGDRPLVFNFVLSETSGLPLAIPTSINDFQLLHCGPYFDRSIDSAPDPRVPFEPDAWQRRVLDGIDAKRSQLVIAPTSAGKTFISFYAMKQVLESNDDDILVYVAPTKALVNQIAAEVQGRFSKTYKYAGNSVWGIHTRDSRINNPTGCQVLVTVPHILQIMLLAPSNANTWARRVKWIIFDEVHCIGQAEDGLIWEQLLLMAPCPIIALSATIGNPDEFNAWLSSTQKAVGNDFDMVQHKHRYSDLRKFVYSPDRSQTDSTGFQGLPENRAFAQLGLDNSDSFSFLHPVSSLVNRSRGIPSDLSLEARDCFTLWQSMSKHQTTEYPLDKALDPAAALPTVVKKIHIINWEKALKAVLHEWMEDEGSPFPAVLKDISSNLTKKPSDRQVDSEKPSAPEEEIDEAEQEEIRESDAKSILPLLSKLHEQDALPGIIFNYDRGLCERICKTLMTQLETAETTWKESSPKWKADLAKWEDYKKMMLKANKRHPPKISKKKGTEGDEGLTKDDLMRDAAGNEASPWASFDPNTPVDKFHFADSRKMTREELGKHEKELIRREVPEWLLAAMRRGIGVHHAGLNRKYRQVCEILFRRGFLRVVIATGTLALGINMPCKTVIFSGDSVFLTALNYRQAAGRAGRRGFDMLGNVVFHGITMSKIHRLISSRLPDINGHFPITTTLVLRLFMLLDESKHSAFAVRSINALLSQPRLYLGGEESKMTVLHHLRFSVEYLRRQYLLDSSGKPLNLAGAVSHLYFTESSSFAFHALLKDGYFHRLCANIDTNRDAVLQELILTLSHLFGRQYCRQADQEFLAQMRKRSSSVVFLPPMPDNAAIVLRKHNQSTLDIYRAYVRTFVDEHLPEPDEALPLTQSKTGGKKASSSPVNVQRRAPTTVRSPFVALSGHGDEFDSIHDLCATARSGVFLEEAVIPYVGLYPEESELPLNAYIYDYFNNADVKALATANRIRRGDVWFVLNDFSMVLATIVTSLSNFMNVNTASDLDFTDVRGEGEEAEDAQEDKLIPDADSGYETASTASGPARPGVQAGTDLPIQVKKKKKVADSWDADADEEDLELEIAAQKEKRDAEIQKMQEKPDWEEGTGLLNVFKSFKALKEEFDTKFRAMWA